MNSTTQAQANLNTHPHQLLKPREAAKLLAISERMLYTLTKRGDIAAVRMGKAVRYTQAELATFISKQMQASTVA